MTSFKNVSRRDFLKFCAGTATLLGLSEASVPRIAKALDQASKKPPVVWLNGQDCTGCTISFVGSTHPAPAEIILDTISLRYAETVMAGAGHVAEQALEEAIAEGGYVLIVEGSIPESEDRFMRIGDKPFIEVLQKATANAAAVIAIGACATYGGIPRGTPSRGQGVGYCMKNRGVPGKPLINLSTCPVHPDHLIGTIVYYLLYGRAPELDALGRPTMFFSNLIHDNCPRRGRFDNGEFLTDWNDPAQKDWCLYLKGCKGPFTHSDCAQRGWNDGLNWCIGSGAPCQGCAEPDFYEGMSPLYDKTKEIGGMKVETIGAVLGGATAVGLAGHFIGQAATGRLGKGGPKDEGGEN